jgi:hypothetical protein
LRKRVRFIFELQTYIERCKIGRKITRHSGSKRFVHGTLVTSTHTDKSPRAKDVKKTKIRVGFCSSEERNRNS